MRVQELESRVSQAKQESASAPAVNREDLLALAEDLPSVWESPSNAAIQAAMTGVMSFRQHQRSAGVDARRHRSAQTS